VISSQIHRKFTDAEQADWHYAHRGELEQEPGEAVDVEFAANLSVGMSFRLPGTEADAIRAAAGAAEMSLSEWIRQACAEAAADDGGLSPTPGRRC
jgi:predicted HicB family RNase H-like nuclease